MPTKRAANEFILFLCAQPVIWLFVWLFWRAM